MSRFDDDELAAAIRTVERRRERHRRQVAAAWQAVAATREGRMVIADLLGWCHVFHPIEETDPIRLATRNGERNIGLMVARMLATDPAEFPAEMRRNDEAAKEWMGDAEYRRLVNSYFTGGTSSH
jgi:phosphoenolpyruvate-protein kinase (PTS system EI component)